MKILTLIFFLFCFATNFAQKHCEYSIDKNTILENKNLDSFLIEFQSHSFSITNDKKNIPAYVEKQLQCIAGDFSIANPNQKFQDGCIADEKLPKRQLIFLAKSKNILVMTYASGGFGTSTHFLFVKFEAGKIIDLWTGVGMGIIKHKSLSEISNYIKIFRTKDWGLNTNMIYL